MLYIILIVVVLVLGYLYSRARMRADDASILENVASVFAVRNSEGENVAPTYPSWLYDDERLKAFFGAQVSAGINAGVPEDFLRDILKNPNYRDKLFNIAGTMEVSGFSFEEQSVAARDMFLKDWG